MTVLLLDYRRWYKGVKETFVGKDICLVLASRRFSSLRDRRHCRIGRYRDFHLMPGKSCVRHLLKAGMLESWCSEWKRLSS